MRADVHFRFKKICVFIKRRQGHFSGESEQGAFQVGYKIRLLEFDSEILR